MRLSILVALCVARIASADPGKPVPPPDHKDESTAVVLSLSTGVLLPIALVGATRSAQGNKGALGLLTAGAIIFGPSAGHWYAGESGGLGIGLRLIGTAAAFIGFVSASNNDCETASCTNDSNHAAYAALGGAALVVGSALWDVATAGRAARRYNASQITVAPAPLSTGGPSTLGLVVGGTF